MRPSSHLALVIALSLSSLALTPSKVSADTASAKGGSATATNQKPFNFEAFALTDGIGLLSKEGKARVQAGEMVGERADPGDILKLLRDINANKSQFGHTMYLIDVIRPAGIAAARIKDPTYTKELVGLLLGDCLNGAAVTLSPVRSADGSRAPLPPKEVSERKNSVVFHGVVPALQKLVDANAVSEIRGKLTGELGRLAKEPWIKPETKALIVGLVGSMTLSDK